MKFEIPKLQSSYIDRSMFRKLVLWRSPTSAHFSCTATLYVCSSKTTHKYKPDHELLLVDDKNSLFVLQ